MLANVICVCLLPPVSLRSVKGTFVADMANPLRGEVIKLYKNVSLKIITKKKHAQSLLRALYMLQ